MHDRRAVVFAKAKLLVLISDRTDAATVTGYRGHGDIFLAVRYIKACAPTSLTHIIWHTRELNQSCAGNLFKYSPRCVKPLEQATAVNSTL